MTGRNTRNGHLIAGGRFSWTRGDAVCAVAARGIKGDGAGRAGTKVVAA
jgi:hypothetical protein